MFARLIALLFALCAASFLHAQSLDKRLQAIASELQEIENISGEGDVPSLSVLARLASRLEDILAEMRQVERDLGAALDKQEEVFFEESQELSNLLGFLMTLEAAPAPDFLIHPSGARGVVEGKLLFEAAIPGIEAALGEKAQNLSGLRELRASQETLEETARLAFLQVNQLRADIVAQERGEETRRLVDQPMVLDTLFAVSENLNGFVVGLNQMGLEGPPPPDFDFEAEKGKIPYPVAGEAVGSGDGVTIETPDLFIKSPFPATVRFAAQFLDYQNMVILEPEDGYLVVVAGMDASAVREGDVIAAGDIIGIFATPEPNQSENAIIDLDTPRKSLYVETRKNAAIVPSEDYFVPQRLDENGS